MYFRASRILKNKVWGWFEAKVPERMQNPLCSVLSIPNATAFGAKLRPFEACRIVDLPPSSPADEELEHETLLEDYGGAGSGRPQPDDDPTPASRR